jgi:predicted NBD/HSP70 family sugar kinase
VRLVNDAHAAAWGEARFGAGRGARDFAFVTVSTGVGRGWWRGRLLLGVARAGRAPRLLARRRSAAGDEGQRRAGARRLGHAIARAGSAAFGRPLTTREVFAAADAGDPLAEAVVETRSSAWRRRWSTCAGSSTPPGWRSAAASGSRRATSPRLRDALARREPADPLPVVAAELGGDAGLLGAADLLGDAAGRPASPPIGRRPRHDPPARLGPRPRRPRRLRHGPLVGPDPRALDRRRVATSRSRSRSWPPGRRAGGCCCTRAT